MAQGTTRGVPIDIDPLLTNDSDLLVPSQKAIKTYVDTNTSTKVSKSGDTMSGALILSGEPTDPLQAVSKNYVDSLINGIDWKAAVYAVTTAALPTCTVSGPYQVLTSTGTGPIPSATLDNVGSVSVGQRILVKNQGSSQNNGIYVVTQVGEVSLTPWILTRASDANTAALLQEATVAVTNGSTFKNSQFHCQPVTVPFTLGVTGLIFVTIGSGTNYTFEAPLVTTGSVISLPAATGSVNGHLISSDWTRFDTAYADRNKWDGGDTGLNAATGRTSLGATTLGSNLFTSSNGQGANGFLIITSDDVVNIQNSFFYKQALGATTLGNSLFTASDSTTIRFLQVNTNNSVSWLDAAGFRTAIGAMPGGSSNIQVTIGAGVLTNLFGSKPSLSVGFVTGGTTNSGGIIDIVNSATAGLQLGSLQFGNILGSTAITAAAIKAIAINGSSSGDSGGAYLSFQTALGGTGSSPVERMRINNTGNILMGSTDDTVSKLQVTGLTKFTGTSATDSAPLGSELALVTGSGTGWALASGATNLNVGGYTHTTGPVAALTTALAATNGAYYQIAYTITGRTAGSITIDYGGTSTSSITASSNTGPLAISTAVLTITPTTDFNGTVVLSVKTIGTSSASSTFANSGGTANIEFRATGNSNTFMGLNVGRRNTTGISNTSLGSSAGSANTTGTQNTFIGVSSGLSNTIGATNSFLGASSGTNNTTGANNVFLGINAASNNTTGSGTVAIGAGAGRYISGGSTIMTYGNNSVFIGQQAYPRADSQQNQIVIGNTAVGLGSNTTVIGNSSITANFVYGKQYFSQPTPTALTATATLTIANLLTSIITVTSAVSVTLTLPTGTLTDAGAVSGGLPTNSGFDWCVINLGSSVGAILMTGDTGHTFVGNTVVAISTSAAFRTVKTATNTYVTYRTT